MPTIYKDIEQVEVLHGPEYFSTLPGPHYLCKTTLSEALLAPEDDLEWITEEDLILFLARKNNGN